MPRGCLPCLRRQQPPWAQFTPIWGVSPTGQVITHPHTPLGWKVGQAAGTMCTSCEGADVLGEPRAESTRVWGAGADVLASPGLGCWGRSSVHLTDWPDTCTGPWAAPATELPGPPPPPQTASLGPTFAPAQTPPGSPETYPGCAPRAEFLWRCCHLSSYPNFWAGQGGQSQ